MLVNIKQAGLIGRFIPNEPSVATCQPPDRAKIAPAVNDHFP